LPRNDDDDTPSRSRKEMANDEWHWPAKQWQLPLAIAAEDL